MAHPMDPLTLADCIGLDDIMRVMQADLDDPRYRPYLQQHFLFALSFLLLTAPK